MRTAHTKTVLTNSTGMNIEDKRGRHSNRPKAYAEWVKQKVIDHIKLFPVVDSDYCRETSTMQYFKEGLNICLMYGLYEKQILDCKIEKKIHRFTTSL